MRDNLAVRRRPSALYLVTAVAAIGAAALIAGLTWGVLVVLGGFGS